MRIIAFDTSTEICTVALGDGARWSERTAHAGSRHSELLLPMIQALLSEEAIALDELDGIAFGSGPGSFTGLRVACGVAQGLALGADLPVVGVMSLEALAEAEHMAHGWTRVVTALDARMQEVYFAAFEREDDSWRTRCEPCVLGPDAVPVPEGRWNGAGSGFAVYATLRERLEAVLSSCDERAVPTAIAIGNLALPRFAAGEGVDARDAAPLYVRHRVALTEAERAAGEKL
jgi:tRNA threonylcarbamoyladenosine biosynthesis protein TsaB